MDIMNVELALSDLKAGIKTVSEYWHDSGHSNQRVTEILTVADAVSWGSSPTGIDVSISQRGPSDDVRVIVLEQSPDRRTELHDRQAFQTWLQFGDKTPTVYFQHVSCTPLWLGIILCHELDHALEYRDGVSKPEDQGSAWDAAEGRAYLHEGLLIDGVTRGRFRRNLTGFSFQNLLKQSAASLSSMLYRDAFTGPLNVPRKSGREEDIRSSALTAAGAMLVASDQLGDSDETLAEAFGMLRRAWFS